MKNLLLYFLLCCSTILVPSCKDKYHITGTAYDGEVADGAQIHIKQEINGEWHTLNSCEILHGNFSMEGDVDTTLLTALFIDDIPTQPLVLEGGKIEVSIQPQIIRITGTEHNDKLNEFIIYKERMENHLAKLYREMSSTATTTNDNTKQTAIQDSITTAMHRFRNGIEAFILDNHHTLLGPCVFRLLCSTLPSPSMTPQIVRLTSNAPDKFLNSPYVKAYMEKAKKNSNNESDKK